MESGKGGERGPGRWAEDKFGRGGVRAPGLVPFLWSV